MAAPRESRESRYLEQLGQELLILAAAIQDAGKGRGKLRNLTEAQREELDTMARRITGHANALEDLAEEVDRANR